MPVRLKTAFVTTDLLDMFRRALALVVMVTLLAAGCGSATPTAAPVPDSLPLADTTTTAAPTTTAPPSTTTTSTTTTSTIPPDPNRTWIATAKDHVTHLAPRVEPDGDYFGMPWTQPNPHQFGTALTLMVTEGQPGDEWVKVQLPIKPNEQEAWVSTEDYDITAVYTRAEVNVTTQKVTVWENGEIIAETDAVVGADASPTPFGDFYVVARVDDYYGEPALALSSFSEAFETFSGGLPVIAIHKTFGAGQESDPNIGSNGCVRIPPETIRFLAENVPLGTPVSVVS